MKNLMNQKFYDLTIKSVTSGHWDSNNNKRSIKGRVETVLECTNGCKKLSDLSARVVEHLSNDYNRVCYEAYILNNFLIHSETFDGLDEWREGFIDYCTDYLNLTISSYYTGRESEYEKDSLDKYHEDRQKVEHGG